MMAIGDRIDPISEWLAYTQEGSDGLVLGRNVLREKGLTLERQSLVHSAVVADALEVGSL
jgi:hypothetical protein